MAARSAATAKRVDLTVALSGPFFDRDPKATFRQNVRAMLAALAEEAAKDVRSQIAANEPQMPHATGHSRNQVVGRTKSLSGKQWALTAVISESTAGMGKREAIRTKAAGASIERRFHSFARTARAVRSSKAVLSANLTKGIE